MKYTPEQIVNEELYFSIPIYQRLFEWNADNINMLLSDLKREYDNEKNDYYIGMLTTVFSSGRYDLVDGQQRFIVIMLIGCVMRRYDERWNNFINNASRRLLFASRPDDDMRLVQLIESEVQIGKVTEDTMTRGINTINMFVHSIDEHERITFASYIYEHLSFFISVLPENYMPQDLNRYFERMNSSGKNLENHEILKVKLLRRIGRNVDKYMTIWNRIADVNTVLIKQKNNEEANIDRKRKALFAKSFLNMIEHKDSSELAINDQDGIPSILEVESSSEEPNTAHYDSDNRCALTFTQLLLQVLYRKTNGKIKGSIDSFFDTNNLLETFRNHLPYEGRDANEEEIIDFIHELYHCRLVLDICFIRPKEYGYDLDMNIFTSDTESDQKEQEESRKKLLMFESMLYVSSSNFTNYRWFNWLMDSVSNHKHDLSAEAIYEDLKECDDNWHIRIPEINEISYGNDMRYWFWRLDFYIWLNRKSIFTKSPKALAVANNYVFRRNRSIEHIAPQHPKSNSIMKWDDTEEDAELRDSFGNLVMISQGLNSALSNESYQVKIAHVQSYINGEKSGTIESLKLLVVHQDHKTWDKESIIEHGYKMYRWLQKSYK